jgi:hypothetical protein
MIEVPDYDKMSELENKLFENYDIPDDALRIVCDLMSLKEKRDVTSAICSLKNVNQLMLHMLSIGWIALLTQHRS